MLISIHTIIFNAKRFVRTKTTSLILDDVEVGFEGKDVLFCVKTLANLLGLGAFSEISFGAKTDHGSTLPLCFKQPGGAVPSSTHQASSPEKDTFFRSTAGGDGNKIEKGASDGNWNKIHVAWMEK